MIFGLQVGLLIVGVMALFTGKLTLRKNRTLAGAGVRIAGLIFLLPLPLSFAIGFILGLVKAMQGQRFDPDQMQGTLILVELGITLACALLGFGTAWAAGTPLPQGGPTEGGAGMAGTSKRAPDRTADATTTEGVLWAEPVAQPQEGITPALAPSSAIPIQVGREPEPRAAGRPRQITRSPSRAWTWAAGAVAVGFLLLLTAAGGLAWWLQTSAIKPQAVAQPRRQTAGTPARIGLRRPEAPPPPPPPAPPPPPPVPVEKKEDPRLRSHLNIGSVPNLMKLSPDGRTLAITFADKSLTLRSLDYYLPGGDWQRDDTKQVVSIAFSPDARWFATCDGGPLVRLRQASTGKQYMTFRAGPNAAVVHVAFAPDSKTLLLVARDGGKLWDIDTGAQRDLIPGGSGDGQITFSAGCFSGDGRRLLLFAHRKSGRGLERADGVWDVASGQQLERLPLFPGRAAGSVFMAPGERYFLLTEPTEPLVRVWDRSAGKEISPLAADTAPTGLDFSPDGQVVVVGYGDGSVRLWDYKAGKQFAQFQANQEKEEGIFPLPADLSLPRPLRNPWAIRGICFSSTGKLLVTGKSHGYKVWNADKTLGRPFRAAAYVPPPSVLSLPSGPPAPGGVRELFTVCSYERNLAFSPDGRRLAAGGSLDSSGRFRIHIWNVHSRRLAAQVYCIGVAGFTPDGKSLLCRSPTNRGVYVMLEGENMLISEMELLDAQTLQPRPGSILCGRWAFSPDGRRLLAGSWKDSDPGLRLYELPTLKELPAWKGLPGGTPFALAFAPDGGSFAVSFSAAYTASPHVHICDAATGKLRLSYREHRGLVRSIAFTPDGRQVATASQDRTIRVWDPATGKTLATFDGHTDAVLAVAYAAGGRLLVSLSSDGSVRLWNTDTKKEMATLLLPDNRSPGALAASPDGKVLAASSGSQVHVWDVSRVLTPPPPKAGTPPAPGQRPVR